MLKCRVPGCEFEADGLVTHITRTHRITTSEYRSRYGSQRLISIESTQIRVQEQRAYWAAHPDEVSPMTRNARTALREKYGEGLALGSKKVRGKIRSTMIQRYGVDNPAKNPEIEFRIRRARERTLLERHGVTSVFQLPDVQKRAHATTKRVHGGLGFGIPRVFAQTQNTLRERYGVPNAYLVPGVRQRGKYAPNKVERKLLELVRSLEYTGDKSRWVPFRDGSYKNPDFVVRGRSRKVVELFGTYWHRGQDPRRLVRKYAQVGFECLVIWEHDLRHSPEKVRAEVLRFVTSPQRLHAEHLVSTRGDDIVRPARKRAERGRNDCALTGVTK